MKPFGFSRLAFSVLALPTVAGSSWSQTADISKDPRLQQPITIKLKIEQLPTALAKLSKASGVKLETTTALKDLKVTVMVQNVPAAKVLEKVAEALDCEWKADGALFRLTMDNDERVRRDRYIDAENQQALKEIQDDLNSLADLSTKDPEALQEQLRQLAGPQRGGDAGRPASGSEQMKSIQEALNPQDNLFGRFLASLDAGRANAFWRGDVIAGFPPGGPAAAPPSGNLGVSSSTANLAGQQRPRALRALPIFVQYDPLLYQVEFVQGNAVHVFAKRPAQLVTQPRPVDALAKLPFGQAVLAWDQALPTDGDLTKLFIKASAPPTKNADDLLTVANYLEKAFDQTGIPIVADAFRAPAASKDFNVSVGPFMPWLQKLKDDNHLYTRFEDGFVVLRHAGFWRLQKFETPEDTVRQLESRVTATQPKLDEYASFVSALTPEELKPFSMKRGSVTRFDLKPIQTCLPALLFYSSLDQRALGQASSAGIAYSQLDATPRQLFTQAALESVFLGAAGLAFTDPLMRLYSSADIRGMGFLLRRQAVDAQGVSSDGLAMLFGLNLREAATYKFALTP